MHFKNWKIVNKFVLQYLSQTDVMKDFFIIKKTKIDYDRHWVNKA